MATPLWKLAHSETVIDTQYFKAVKQRYVTPAGDDKEYWYSELPNWVAVAAFTEQNEIVLVKQHRYAVQKELLELPAGIVDAGESPEETAVRELLEETGYRTTDVIRLGAFHPAPGKVRQTCTLCLAEVNGAPLIQQLDGDESIQVTLMPAKVALQKVFNGEIQSLATAAGLAMARHVRPEFFLD